jgi:hypothetical protein
MSKRIGSSPFIYNDAGTKAISVANPDGSQSFVAQQINTPADIVPGVAGLSVTAVGDVYSGSSLLEYGDAVGILKRKLTAGTALKLPVMASPPAVVAQGSQVDPAAWVDGSAASKPLASAQVIPCLLTASTSGALDPRFSVSGAENKLYVFSDVFNFFTVTTQNPDTSNNPTNNQIRFRTNAPYLGIAVSNTTNLALTIDGELVSNNKFFTAYSGVNRSYVTINNRSRKIREYCVYIPTGSWFGGIAIGPNDTLYAPPKGTLQILGETDSYGSIDSRRTSAGILSDLGIFLNADFAMYGAGGTGYINVNAGYPNFLSRLPTAIRSFGTNANVFLAMGSINDTPGAALTAGCLAYFAAVRAALPRALIIAIGPWCPIESNVAAYTARLTAVFAGVRAAGGRYMLLDNLHGTFELSNGVTGSLGGTAWQTGTIATAGATSPPVISTISRATNVVSVTTATAHGAVGGNTILVCGQDTFNGQFTVATAPTGTTLTYAQIDINETGIPNAGRLAQVSAAGSGAGAVFGAANPGDVTHYNQDGAEYISQCLLTGIATAIQYF